MDHETAVKAGVILGEIKAAKEKLEKLLEIRDPASSVKIIGKSNSIHIIDRDFTENIALLYKDHLETIIKNKSKELLAL